MDLGKDAGIGEDEVARSQPFVRSLMVQRLEGVWSLIQDHVARCKEDERPIDPRYLDLGLRAMKELARIYRLDKEVKAPEAEDPTRIRDPAALVLEQLRELEARSKGTETSP
jgi:hypothetical protein